MAKFNQLAMKILSEKYFAEGESTPEHLFIRVASSIAFVDALYRAPHVVTDISEEFLREVKGTLGERTIYVKSLKLFNKEVMDHGLEHTYNNLVAKGMRILQATDIQDSIFSDKYFQDKQAYMDSMLSMNFMPGTPTLINIGRPIGMLSSCFFLRVHDSMDDIFDKVKQVALISKSGGGVGLDISELRPKGARVKDTNGTSSGPISFLKVFNETGNQVQQGGIRRAALIATMRVDHPDILEFITCKEEEGTLSNFNMSVIIDNNFMKILEKDEEIILEHDSVKPVPIKASIIWKKIIKMAHKNGEPGVIFKDTIAMDDVFSNKYGDLGVNPCGEITLLPYESCNLGAINLANMVQYPYRDKAALDTDKLIEMVKLGVTFLDNIIEINKFPLPEIQTWTEKTRRIGLGVMGLHDLMLKLKIIYGDTESLDLISNIYGIIQQTAYEQTRKLGELRGVPPDIAKYAVENKNNFRNAGLLAAQPTGTVAMICNQASSGIEPVFQFEYGRKDSYGEHSIKHFIKKEFPEQLPEYAVTALDITPKHHIDVQARLQTYIDNSISKTVNLPNTATEDVVEDIIRQAFYSGCKSVTMYRSGSRSEEVLSEKVDHQEKQSISSSLKSSIPSPEQFRERPRVLFGATTRINTPGGKAYITVNEDKEGAREVFIHISKAGSEINTHVESEGRLISNSLKYRVPPTQLIQHMEGHKSNPILDDGVMVRSVPDAVATVMREYLNLYEGFSDYIEEGVTKPTDSYTTPDHDAISGEICPECGEVLYMAGGCTECISCGFSRCG